MNIQNKIKIELLLSLIIAFTIYPTISNASAVWPLDEFTSARVNETANQSSVDHFQNLSGEYGEYDVD